MRNLLWQSDAWDEYIEIQPDKKLLRRVNRLLKDIMRNGYQCTYGKAENSRVISADTAAYVLIRRTE